MAKIDKTKYTKQEWRKIKEQRRLEKELSRQSNQPIRTTNPKNITDANIRSSKNKIAFVLGNGVSRKPIVLDELKQHGTVYACNAVYRHFQPDFLVAVDVKMILEINKSGYQKNNQVWTNPNRAYDRMQGFNFFQPSKGWSSGPTALWLASQHQYDKIFILGFDYKGLSNGSKTGYKFNNIYANTGNYKNSHDSATFFGNWLRQTASVVKENANTNYIRVIAPDNYKPEELNKFSNFSTWHVEDFQKFFSLS